MAPKYRSIWVANTSGSVEIKGEAVIFTKDHTRVYDGDPLLKAVPSCFTKMDDLMAPEVEQATAAPGESRPTKRRTRRKPAAKAEPKPAAKPEPKPTEGVNDGPTKGLTMASLRGE